MIARQVALDYPHRVSRPVLTGTPITLLDNEAVLEFVRTLEDPVPHGFYREFAEGIIHHPVPEEFLSTLVSEGIKVPARVWRDYWEEVALTVDYREQLGEIGMPTLILWGEWDHLLPREEQERMAAAIPDATLKAYPETGRSGSSGIWRSLRKGPNFRERRRRPTTSQCSLVDSGASGPMDYAESCCDRLSRKRRLSSSLRLFTPTFSKTCERCPCTVDSEMYRAEEICFVEQPRKTSLTTSLSRPLRP